MQNQDTQHSAGAGFTYRPNPLLARSFLICRKDQNGDVSPIGDYTVLDAREDVNLSERKVMNLVMRLNGESDLVPLGDQTKSRLLFHCKPQAEDDLRSTVIFYTYAGNGISTENAILTLEGFNA